MAYKGETRKEGEGLNEGGGSGGTGPKTGWKEGQNRLSLLLFAGGCRESPPAVGGYCRLRGRRCS